MKGGDQINYKATDRKYPKILVISNNSFNSTTNNGKTFASFFDEYPANSIAQLYFNHETPDYTKCNNYFRVTDRDIIKYFFKNNTCGNIINYSSPTGDNNSQNKLVEIIKKYNFARIIREVLWKSEKWKTELLDQWLNEFSPEVIFFCAGDSGFAYDITKYIQKKFHTKLVVYITDDYILPRKTISLFWWIRRNYILNQMREAVQGSDLFITISRNMRNEYKKLFGKDSIIAVNMTESMKNEAIHVENKNILTLVYAGGFHFRRYKTLNLLARALKKYNDDYRSKQKVFLRIYSTQEPSHRLHKSLNIERVSKFCGKLDSKELKRALNNCDILVHVESFDSKCIESTRLSISTKIPEYLSLGKPILAIGPSQIASMEYLKDTAFCITDCKKLYSDLTKLFHDKELQEELSLKALQKYEANHRREIVKERFVSSIMNIYITS